MPSFPWLPLNTEIADAVKSNKVLAEGEDYQVLDTQDGQKAVLLIKDGATWLAKSGKGKSQKNMLSEASIIEPFEYEDEKYWIYITSKNMAPAPVQNLIRPVGTTCDNLNAVGMALSEMNGIFYDAVFDTALFLEHEKICIATEFDPKRSKLANKKSLATRLLVGAVMDTNLKSEVMRKLNPDLSAAQIKDFYSLIGIEDEGISVLLEKTTVKKPEDFSLPGRPELEEFFRENIIDYFHRYKEYERMGIKPPSGILLYGPPGTGKTYSVKKLADFLGWNVYEIDMGSVGSPYIHQTSRLLKETFDKASETAPSIVLMEEIDALTGERSGFMNEHKIEEIAQLLRLIEIAAKQGILVIGTTNRFESMDQAIVRRGRFDHVIELGFPSQVEIMSAVDNLLKGKPTEDGLDLEEFSNKLAGHPMSDIAWAINDAARYAVKHNKQYIDRDCLMNAANNVLSNPRRQ